MQSLDCPIPGRTWTLKYCTQNVDGEISEQIVDFPIPGRTWILKYWSWKIYCKIYEQSLDCPIPGRTWTLKYCTQNVDGKIYEQSVDFPIPGRTWILKYWSQNIDDKISEQIVAFPIPGRIWILTLNSPGVVLEKGILCILISQWFCVVIVWINTNNVWGFEMRNGGQLGGLLVGTHVLYALIQFPIQNAATQVGN